ncbi:hypothetical protein X762_03740 [Mesorhizobium sp. LSHC426A00]|nr:hypothetical protein X770_04860 [Mesorhizobium sp. LSJC269B00]ESX20555.1 hypothetical protein X767_21025 [Mesorhizobium sp. LSJC264A00]ESX32912.1 hypothetical protein X765_06005 [Mesorhizobium sp. LSHC440B00]ESX40020.1 hypothetical protein X763_02420 [Mesorhizobium sp. LSHC432A00]ESX52584.1 hypothetical protein X762_03740 [Mesorhizobium sp. LSHC426A00]ESX59272.1 hypothetical protein X761_01040 [Mesorhizobium sp. LSHC424B00]ESX76640.1 hypothetical protein X758_02760 [Mesorhizobium sp. LSHC4
MCGSNVHLAMAGKDQNGSQSSIDIFESADAFGQ